MEDGCSARCSRAGWAWSRAPGSRRRFGQASAIVAGVYALTSGQPLLALVALFVFLGAGAEAAAVETRVAGEGLNVGADDGDPLPDDTGARRPGPGGGAAALR